MVNPTITIRNMELTAPIKDYAANKIAKHAEILDKATHVNVEITEVVPHRGVAQDFVVEINVKVPGTLIRVAEKGEDVYSLIDKVTDQLARKMKRYEDKFSYWEGEKSLKELEMDYAEEEMEEVETADGDQYQVELPEISKRVKANAQPMSPEEAIERMELTGGSSWLFKNIDTGSWSMVYRRIGGGYGLIEPEE